MSTTCFLTGCTNAAHSRGLCATHYTQLKSRRLLTRAGTEKTARRDFAIRAARRAGMTQQQIAEVHGITRQRVQMIVAAGGAAPTPRHAKGRGRSLNLR